MKRNLLFKRGGSIAGIKKNHLLVKKREKSLSCSASCTETEGKLWDLWDVNLHRGALECMWGNRKGRGKNDCNKEEGKMGLTCKPWAPCWFLQWISEFVTAPMPQGFHIFIHFLPQADRSSVKMSLQALSYLLTTTKSWNATPPSNVCLYWHRDATQ